MKNSLRINRAHLAKKTFNVLSKSRWLLIPLMLITLCVGNAWGAQITASETIEDFATANNWSNSTKYKSLTWDSHVTITAGPSNGSNTGQYNSGDNTWRLYKSESSTLTIEVEDGFELVSFTLTFNSANNGSFKYGNTTIVSGTSYDVTGETSITTGEVTGTSGSGKNKKNGTINITAISVTYQSTGPSCTDPTTLLSISNTNTATVGTNKTLTTSGGNNGTVTWTVANGTGSATVSGSTLTPTGAGTVTVTATQDDNEGKCGKVVQQTITISKAAATIQLNDAGSGSTPSGSFYGGDSYDLPTTAASCTGKELVGWSTVEILEEGAKPTNNYYDKGTSVTLAAGMNTFYAVYANAEEGDPVESWQQCTAISDFVDGDFYMFVSPQYNNTYYYVPAVSSTTAANNFSKANEAVASNSSPTTVTKAQGAWKLIKSNSSWKIQSSNSATTYLYATSDNNGLSANTATNASSTWSITKHSTASTFAFQYNSSRYLCAYSSSPYGFRTYTGTSTNGTAYLTVYHLTSSSGTTYSNYATTCCQPLAQINGSVLEGQTVSWTEVTDASGYKVKVDNGDWTDIGNKLSYTPTLTCGSGNHSVYVKAYNTNNAGHCTGDGPEGTPFSVPSAACTEPELTATPTSLTGLSYIVGQGASVAQSFSISGSNLQNGNLTITAPTDYEVSKTSATTGFANSVTVSANGTLSATNIWVRLKAGKTVGNYNSEVVAITGCGLASAVNVTVSGSVLKPTISVDPTSITGWNAQTGSAPSPATKTITVTGSNLKADISASLTEGSDYFTITPSGLAQSNGSVTNGSVVIGVTDAAYATAGTRAGTLRLSTTDGDYVDISIALTVTDDPREKFTLLTSENLSEIGDGTKMVIVESGRDYAMNKTQDGTNGHGYIGSTNQFEFLSSNAIIALNTTNDVEVLTLEQQAAGYYALKTLGNNYIYYNSGNKFSEAASLPNPVTAGYKWTVGVDDIGYAQIQSTNYIGFNNDASTSKFRSYSDNTKYPIYAYFKASTTPKVNISGTLSAFTYMRDNGPSAAQSFKVSGSKLTANLVVTAPTNYEVCTTADGEYAASVEFTPSNGSVAETDVYIRLQSGLSIANNYNDDITVSSTGAANATLAVTGSVTTPVYTVTLNTNGGTINAGAITEYTEGVGATLPTDVTRDGFSFDGWFANEGLTGSAVTTIATNATGAKEYWAGWTELPGYDVVWYVDGVSYTEGDPTTHVVYNGSISKLPSDPTSLDITSKTFVGWTTAAVTEKQNAVPSPLYTAANDIPGSIQAKQEFYAVFAQQTNSGTFTKVTDASTLAAGDRLLIYANSNAAGTLGSNNYLTKESVTTSNNNITNKQNASVWVLGGTYTGWTLTSTEGTLKCYGTDNNNLSMSNGVETWTISISNGNATIKNTTHTTYIKFNSSGNRFSSYASGQTAVQLYREGTSLTDYTTKFVKPIAVTSVSLNKNATTLAIGGTETLTATVAPANATNQNISWSSDATSVATVTSAGVVTAVSAGEATITVTTEDGSKTATCVVTVLPTVETPTFSPAAGAINKGSKVTISCATEGASILYSLDGSDPSLAYPDGGVAINANCTLKAKATKTNYTTSAVAEAAYTIIKASQTVSFTTGAYAFRLSSAEYTAFTGQTASSTYNNASISYTSSNTSVATVNASTGVVALQGVKGTTTITATAAEDDDYASAFATYTITVLRAGVTRTGDFVLVTDASQLADGDYILLAGATGYNGYTPILKSLSTSSAQTYQNKTVANDEITYSQFLEEGNTAKIITLEKDGNYYSFNYGTDADLYISAGSTTSAHDLSSTSTISDAEKWSIVIDVTTHVATVTNKNNTSAGKILCNSSNSQFRAYTNGSTAGTLSIYKQKDKNKLPQTLSFTNTSYEFPLNESAYIGFVHQTVSGAQTAVTYTTNNAAVADIVENVVVLQGGVGTATITATAAESDDYEHATATYTITVTAALNTVTFHYYNATDASAAQTALKEETSGAGITVPAKPVDVGEYTFLGWAPATLDETQTAPINIVAALQADATYHPSANGEEYYAIYRRLENSDGRFYLMQNNTYAKAPVDNSTTSFGNTTNITEAAKFIQTEDNKLYYDNNGTPRYVSSTSTTTRDLDFTTNAADAKVWTITENGTTITLYSTNSSKYLYHNGSLWAAYATIASPQANQSKNLTKVYLARVYYTSTPDKMVSPVLTWAQGNATHVMEIEDTYDNAATATVGGEPVSVTYSSSDETKATVNENGVVTALLGGTVTISATVAANPGVSRELVESYEVTITKKVPVITFDDNANYKVYVGEAYKRVLAGNVSVTTDGAVTYTLSNNATENTYAAINTTTGEVTGLSTGNQSSVFQYLYVHTAETDMYQEGVAYKQFNVLALKNQPLAFGQASYSFNMNESVEAFMNTLSGAVTTVAYESDNTSVAEVDSESGEVTVHSNVCGVATITATAAEGQVGDDVYKAVSQTYTITVNYPAPTFSVESGNIKAPVALAISGYDEETKLYYTDGNEDPTNLYSEPIVISETKTIRAKATNADGTLVSPIASVTLTKVVPSVEGTEDKGTITLSADEGALITYIILNQNAVTVAEGIDVVSPVVFNTELSGTYTVQASAKWDVENGFTSEDYDNDFDIKGKGHLPINSGNGLGFAAEPWASKLGNVGTYANENSGDQRIKFDASGQALIAAFVEKPIQLSYQIKHNSSGTAWSETTNVYKVQWSADGENYTDIVVYNNSNPISTDAMTETFDLNESARYIKWTYTNKTASTGGNVALGQISITCEAVVIDGVSVVDIPEDYTGDVVVEEEVTWAPSGTPEVNNLIVKQGAVVDLDQAVLIVNDVILESQEGYSGQILEADNFEAEGNVYYDLTLNTTGTMDNSKWYAFAVPFQVDAATGIQRLSNDGVASPAGFNSHYVLLKYDSNQRCDESAQGEAKPNGWKYVTAGETLDPGNFYMVALNSNAYNRLRMTKKANATLNNQNNLPLNTYTKTGAQTKDQNWNALANNALAYVNVSAEGGNSTLKVQVYNSAEDKYDEFDYDEVTFTVGTPFFVQAATTGSMSVTIAATNNETVKAPNRAPQATEEFQIRLGADTESYYDKLYVSASEDALNEYQIGHDLAKMGVSTVVPQMYVPAYGAKLCDAEFPLAGNKADFPLTINTPSEGTYQLYIAHAPQDASLFLTRNGSIIWNLSMSPYEVELPQGQNNEYGLRLVAAPKVSTDIEQSVVSDQSSVQKVIIDEHVYILRGETLYDVNGQLVK